MKRRKFLLASAATLPVVAGHASGLLPGRAGQGFVVRAGQDRFGQSIKLYGQSPNQVKVSAQDTAGQLCIFEYTGAAKGGPPLHVHPKQDEVFYVLAGEYLFQVGSERHTLGPGDTIFLPRGVPHTFAQLTDAGRLLFLMQPAGKMEAYFQVLGALAAPPSPPEGAKIFADHEMEVVGPPLSF
jgi:quercetin dioxygenase-like cupin family protein